MRSGALLATLAALPVLLAALPARGPAQDAGDADAGDASVPDRMERAVAKARQDLDQARARLVRRRKEISTERIERASGLRTLEAEVGAARDERDRLRDDRDEARDARFEHRERADSLEARVKLLRTLLVDTRRNLETQLDLVDANSARDRLEGIDELLAAGGEKLPEATARLLEMLGEHAGDASRIRRTPGTALGPDGRQATGTFVRAGDALAYFAGDDLTGIVQLVHGSVLPHVFTALPDDAEDGLRTLADGGEGEVPVDVTAGAALRTEKAQRGLLELIRAGGLVMIPILAIGALGLLLGILKLVHLLRIRSSFDPLLARVLGLLREGRTDEARAFAAGARRPARGLLEACVEYRSLPREELEEVLHEAILVETPRLERHLAMLSVGAAVSPLLGLLGTVTGMIRTFGLISVFGTGDPRLLSAGISEALITTEAGLVVAIPLVLLHAFLARRVHTIAEGLEAGAIGFLNARGRRDAPASASAATGGSS